MEKLHDSIKAGAAKSLGNKAKSKLSEIGKAHAGKTPWADVAPIDAPSTKLHHDINAYIDHHKNGSGVTPVPPAAEPEPAKKSSPISEKTHALLKGISDNLGNVTPAFKEAAHNKMDEINKAVTSGDKVNVAAVQPIPNAQGMMQTKINEYIASLKSDLGITPAPPATPAYSPTPAQVQQATKINTAPPKRTHQEHYYEDADGKELKSVLKASTKSIPEGFYGKVMAAYGGDHSHKQGAQLTALDPVLESYANHVFTKQLDHEEVSATEAYQNGTYGSINKACNGLPPQPPDAYTQKSIEKLTSAMAKAVVPADTPVYRGVTCSLKSLTGFDDPKQAVGRCFEHGNFASCSRSHSKANSFGGGNILMKFTVPAGSRGITMRKQSWERELLLDKSSMFRVDKIEAGAEGAKHVVHCTFLGYKEAHDAS